MARSLYLINPRSEFPSYFGAEANAHWGLTPAASFADLAIVTVAALAPEDWSVEVCDEYVTPVDFDSTADFIGITGKITQAGRMIEVAEEFRRRGKTVIIGGPFASLSPEEMRDHCDILVIGELEDIAEEFFAALEGGDWKKEYVADRPDLALSPIPRWDLYPNDRAQAGCIQTSRGCPFECEFCDVIQYLGRQQRHKSVEQILAELEVLYSYGYRAIFLADDNLTAYRKRAKEVLAALRDWNEEHLEDPVAFSTQVSIDAARDPEIMRLSAEAGLLWVFVGIETPNEESLRETKKRQNVGVDLRAQIQVFLDHGISVIGGMIVGFDHDGLDIFQRQYDFAMSTGIPLFSVGALVAPAATPLHERMRRDGRLIDGGSEVAATPWDTNIIPTGMTREQLFEGLSWLCNNLYSPASFGRRMLQMIDSLGPQRGPFRAGIERRRSPRRIDSDSLSLLKKIIRTGPEERSMWSGILTAIQEKPDAELMAMSMLIRYAQVRCLYEVGRFWEPQVAEQALSIGTLPEETSTDGLVTIGPGTA